MAWVAAAVGAVSLGGGIYGAISGNQNKQRNKGYISDNYRLASQALDTHQANTAQGTAESLNARGLSPIQSAMGATGAPTTLGGQVQANEQKQFGLERKDLTQQKDAALNQNNVQGTNSIISSIVGGVGGALSAYGAHQDLSSSPVPARASGLRVESGQPKDVRWHRSSK
jgi:hypothetical protein